LSTGAYAVVSKPAAKVAAKAGAVANAARGKKTWALLVGISKYESPQITSLTYPASDVASIADALKDPTLGNVPADHILMLTNDQATAANIKGAVDTFFKPNVKPGDSIIIFLAGHGVAKGVGSAAKGYLLPYDVRGLTTPALDASAVSLRDLSTALGQLPASQFIAFVDACREDPTPGRGVMGNVQSDVVMDSMQIVPDTSNLTTHPNSVTYFACSVGQRAYEDPKFQHGVFTYNILNSLKSGPIVKSDGEIDMAYLANSVGDGVATWAKEQSSSGDFEVDQTPQLVPATTNTALVTLMDVARPPTSDLPALPQPAMQVSTYPEGANVNIDGKDYGAGTVLASITGPGQHIVKAAAPGYAPFEKTFNALPGYPAVINLTLPPAGRGVTGDTSPAADIPESYTKAVDLEQNKEYSTARAGFKITIAAHPDFAPAYEHLANLERLNGSIIDEVGTLIDMTGQTPPTGRDLALLANAYTDFCLHGPGVSDGYSTGSKGKDYKYPHNQKEAGDFAVKAATAAVAADASLAEAQRALGFAIVAQDAKLKNEAAATNAFSAANFMDDKDAANHYGVGYCKRIYAQNIKNKDQQSSRLQEAIAELNKAIALRPNYYEAHRELGYCYHMMDDRPNAEKEYQIAEANRGQASDPNEFAGTQCAMSALYGEDAKNTSDPDKKKNYLAASDGFAADAKELAPNLKVALGFLRQAGISTDLLDALPGNLRDIADKIPGAGSLGNLGGLFGHH